MWWDQRVQTWLATSTDGTAAPQAIDRWCNWSDWRNSTTAAEATLREGKRNERRKKEMKKEQREDGAKIRSNDGRKQSAEQDTYRLSIHSTGKPDIGCLPTVISTVKRKHWCLQEIHSVLREETLPLLTGRTSNTTLDTQRSAAQHSTPQHDTTQHNSTSKHMDMDRWMAQRRQIKKNR
jgi:hypothetical protein